MVDMASVQAPRNQVLGALKFDDEQVPLTCRVDNVTADSWDGVRPSRNEPPLIRMEARSLSLSNRRMREGKKVKEVQL